MILIIWFFFSPTEGKTRKVKLDENFFTGYRRTILEPSEILEDILVPFTEKVIKNYLILELKIVEEIVTLLLPIDSLRRQVKCNELLSKGPKLSFSIPVCIIYFYLIPPSCASQTDPYNYGPF